MKLPHFICHDVLQRSFLRSKQRRFLEGYKNLDDMFLQGMRIFEGQPCTLVVLGEGLVDSAQSGEVIAYIKTQPQWRIQCHGYHHVRYDNAPTDKFRKHLGRAAQLIEQTFGAWPTEYYPPWNKYTPETKAIAAELGMDQKERYRKPGHYKHEWHNCAQVDFHYWDLVRMKIVHFIVNYFTVQPHYIVGAPRSGTTALMRFLTTNGTVALKEKEGLWSGRPDLRAYYATVLGRENATGILDKNVRNTFRVLELQKQFPGARFTHLIRDGRAAISSWRDWAVRTGKADQSIKGAAEQWCRYVGYLLDHRHELTDYEEVRYEHLCARNEYFQSRNDKWHKRLTPDELGLVMRIAGPLLRRLGYV